MAACRNSVEIQLKPPSVQTVRLRWEIGPVTGDLSLIAEEENMEGNRRHRCDRKIDCRELSDTQGYGFRWERKMCECARSRTQQRATGDQESSPG